MVHSPQGIPMFLEGFIPCFISARWLAVFHCTRVGLCFVHCVHSESHMFPMRFRSGLWARATSVYQPAFSRASLVALALWARALSCIKWNFVPILCAYRTTWGNTQVSIFQYIRVHTNRIEFQFISESFVLSDVTFMCLNKHQVSYHLNHDNFRGMRTILQLMSICR